MSHWVRVILEEAFQNHASRPESAFKDLKRIIEIVEGSDVFQFRTAELAETADAISVCDSLTELSRLIWRAATTCGFQHFALFVVNQGRGPVFASRMLTSFSNDWVTCYEKNAYQFIDPIVTMARLRDGGFLFAEAESCAPTVQTFWNDAERHGVGRNGLCYSASRPDNSRIAVSFFSINAEQKACDLIRLNKHDLEAISQLAIECFCDVSNGSAIDENLLTNNELRFLHTLATADNPKAAFDQLAQFGGNVQIQSAVCRKLDVTTVFQAIAIASSRQWFDALPYYADEIVTPISKLEGCDTSTLDTSPNSEAQHRHLSTTID